MELETLKSFVRRDVEVLVGGVWMEGHMTPIVKSVVVLLPIGAAKEFYGPTACKAENIQAIREVKRQPTVNSLVPSDPSAPPTIHSSFDPASSAHPGKKFIHK
jgi:hypothetical protein